MKIADDTFLGNSECEGVNATNVPFKMSQSYSIQPTWSMRYDFTYHRFQV